MRDSLTVLSPVILAQAFGVALAWGVDALSWKWRRYEKTVFALNFFGLVTLPLTAFYPLVIVFLWDFFSLANVATVLGALLFWLLCVAWVQKQQMTLSLRATFCGALMQLLCFGWILGGSFLLAIPLLIFLPDGLFDRMTLVWLVSATLTYALLSLFRPTISAMATALRQSFRKNRPLR